MSKRKSVSPRVAVAASAGGLSPLEGLFVQRALSSEGVKHALETLVPSGVVAPVDVTVRFRGTLTRGAETSYKPTARALRCATLALLVRRMGCTREDALSLLTSVLVEAQQLDASAEGLLLAEHPEVGEAFDRVDAFVATLPRIPAQGRVKLLDVTIEKLA